jgi:hypothetical protein
MRAIRFPWLGLLAPFALAGLPASADAQAPGSEFQINTYTTSHQRTIGGGGDLVAADASGNFVVVWYSAGQDGSGYGIFGQRFDSAGGTLGSESRVNSYTKWVQSSPTVASDQAGTRRRPEEPRPGRKRPESSASVPTARADARAVSSA